ncbi:MAG TPA: tripartite tricarboxylate transporter substrate binding protein [Burkholderiales bacterium]|jgi:tripartite-type tricarboxylate transporter receptor subunit TctC|nr:tripartite tricarboxylate transporter substrate binding protein [Burkholderiales bacterium]
MKTFIAFLFAAISLAASAQSYPTKPVKILVPAQPGGGLDLIGRTMADQLSKAFDQSFIVENSAGGGGAIASQATARAAPDGYTLMVAYVGTHGTNPAVRKLPYDAIKDFTPIAMVGGTPNLVVISPAVPANDLKSFIDYAKANPTKLNYGTGGIGLLNHLALEQFRAAAQLPDAVYAHYRGIGPAIQDMLGNQIQVLMPGLAAALPHIRAGKLKPLAITGLKRHPLVPDLPTFEELGYKGFDGVQWYGIAGPAKLPADVTRTLNTAINKAIQSPALQQRLASEAITVMPMTPEQFGQFIQADIARWSALAKARNIHLDD